MNFSYCIILVIKIAQSEREELPYCEGMQLTAEEKTECASGQLSC